MSRVVHGRATGDAWYEQTVLPCVSPITRVALLFTLVRMFAFKGETIAQFPLDVARIAVPPVIYFAVVFFVSFFMAKKLGADYERSASLAFTPAGKKFRTADGDGKSRVWAEYRCGLCRRRRAVG